MFDNENHVGFLTIKISIPSTFVSHFKQIMKMGICQQRHMPHGGETINVFKHVMKWQNKVCSSVFNWVKDFSFQNIIKCKGYDRHIKMTNYYDTNLKRKMTEY